MVEFRQVAFLVVGVKRLFRSRNGRLVGGGFELLLAKQGINEVRANVLAGFEVSVGGLNRAWQSQACVFYWKSRQFVAMIVDWNRFSEQCWQKGFTDCLLKRFKEGSNV